MMLRFLASLIVVCSSNSVWALGEFKEGNAPQPPANYSDWPGIVDAVNDQSRVFLSWVNGNETSYFKGDAAITNRVLKEFAETEVPELELILLPGPTNDMKVADQAVKYDFTLNVMGGVVKGYVEHFHLEDVLPLRPTMTLYVSDQLKLEDLEIPPNLQITQLSDLQARYERALKRGNNAVKSRADYHFGALTKQFQRTGDEFETLQAQLTEIEEFVKRLEARRNVGSSRTSTHKSDSSDANRTPQ